MTLNAIQLDAGGDLKSGYLIRGGASLPGEGGAVALSLDGRVDAQGADIRQLRLDAGGEQRLELVGRLDWREAWPPTRPWTGRISPGCACIRWRSRRR